MPHLLPFHRQYLFSTFLLLLLIGSSGCRHPDLTGTLVFASSREGEATIYTMQADGTDLTRVLVNPDRADGKPALSPDGTHIAYDSYADKNADIYVVPVDGGTPTRLTDHPALDTDVAWSPDGSRLVFVSTQEGNQDIYVMQADGSHQTNLTRTPTDEFCPAWSPDGTRIAFSSNQQKPTAIYVMQADGSNPVRLTQPTMDEFCPAWSPDGSRIAFLGMSRDRHGRYTKGIYTVAADGTGLTEVIRTTNDYVGFQNPTWSPDGIYLAFTFVQHDRTVPEHIHAIKPDGTGRIRLRTDGGSRHPSWGP